jgi:hypothetical protein
MKLSLRVVPAVAIFLFGAAPLQRQDAEFDQKVRALFAQLKDRNIAMRKKAEEDLFQMGPAALPILRVEEARLTPGDQKQRAGLVIKRIERKRTKDIASGSTLMVTLNEKDRPVAELLAELQRMTSVPIDHRGIPAGATSSIEASPLSLWEAVDAICKNHGKLAWDVSGKGIAVRRETYSRPFMATESGYALIVRPYLRYPPGQGTGDRDYLRSEVVVAGPPGVVSVAQFITYDALADDKGTNLLAARSGLVTKSTIGEYRMLPAPDMERPFFESVPDNLDASPGRGAARVKVCKGVAIVRAILELERQVEIRGTDLKKGARAAGFGIILDLESVETTGAKARLQIAITDTKVGSRKERRLFYLETGGKVVLKDAAGHEIPCEVETSGGPSPGPDPTQEITRFKVQAALQPGTTINGIEIWQPINFEEIKIPFDFKDVPIKRPK